MYFDYPINSTLRVFRIENKKFENVTCQFMDNNPQYFGSK